jgi:hypothetical protein
MTPRRAAARAAEVEEQMEKQMEKLSRGERIVLFASALLVVTSILPLWASYEATVRGGGIDQSSSESFTVWSDAYTFVPKLAILLALMALGLVIAKIVGANIKLPAATGVIYAAVGGVATLLLLVTVLFGPREFGLEESGFEAFGVEASFDVSRGLFLFLGLVLAAAIAVGGYLHMQEEGETATTTGPAVPPPPPA